LTNVYPLKLNMIKIKRLALLFLSIFIFYAGSLAQKSRPNIIMFWLDDYGMAGLFCTLLGSGNCTQ